MRRGDLLFLCLIKSLVLIIFITGVVLAGSEFLCGSQSEPVSRSPQAAPQAKSQEILAKAEPEKIIPGPQNIKERTAIFVFLGWMWVSIAVLVYILRLKIKETDRLYFSRYFSPEKK
jgi:hypothetical protein